ncbi:MAG: hypothetical protein V7731_08840 [Amphritea sp.]
MKNYLQSMPLGTLILWCYIIWYLVMVAFYFDGSFTLWGNSIGLSLIVGFALVLATGPLSKARIRQQFWQVTRLFLCPFCVSSFSALTKGKGFSLLVSPVLQENLVALTLCMLFCGLVYTVKRVAAEYA